MQLINEKSPCAAYGIAAMVCDKVFVHGGIRKQGDSTPLSDFNCYDFKADKWINLQSSNSPSLSYHAAYVTEDRFINIIGGWNGKIRTSDVNVFDTHHQVWLGDCTTTGFPAGAGLSSHTVTPLMSDDVLIVGRMGGLQMQRKWSSVLLCKRSNQTRFQYSELPMRAASRSGHTCIVKSANVFLVMGGRDNNEGNYMESINTDHVLRPQYKLEADELQLQPTSKFHCRKYHSSIPLDDEKIFVFGGEHCSSGIKSEPLSDGAVVTLNNRKWYNCGNFSGPKLTGHQTIAISDRCFVVGGFTDKWRVNKGLFELLLK